MRVLLALLALVGLLLSPIAASAAAPACLHHHDAAQMAATMGMAGPQDAGKGGGMPCCDDDAGKAKPHDSQACAQACAVVCGVNVALPEAPAELALTVMHARFEPAAPVPLHAHGPPGLKRPPKHHA